MPQSRHGFLSGSAAVFASIAFVRAPARAAQYTFKWGHATQLNHPLHINAVLVKNEVLARSGGRLAIELFPNSTLGGDTAMLAQARTGALEMYSGYGGIYANVAPIAGIEAVGFAFKNQAQALAAFDGPLGGAIRKEMDAKGPFVTFERAWVNGFRQVTSSIKPVRSVDDIQGLKIRTPPTKIWVDMFRTLGAAPTPINASEMYTALQTHVVDAQENPFTIVETYRLYEVQKYLSVTNHMWSNFWVVANADRFKALPPDLQTILRDAVNKHAISNRRDMELSNASIQDKLRRRGMQINPVDSTSFRAKLRPFYTGQRAEFGPTAWALLEKTTGTLA